MTYDELRALLPDFDAQIAADVAKIPAEHLRDDGRLGAQMRMETALTAPFLLWLAHEINRSATRGTKPSEIAFGAAAGISAFVKSLADNLARSGRQAAFVGDFLASVAVDMEPRLRGDPSDRLDGGQTIVIDVPRGRA
ncbi:hypothetical protein [Methylocella sp.]|uniref:hypothetical protein n=1 Tax=Methylocella sp. TaxID=1978226 RepID=UPI0035B29E7C